MYKIYFIFLFIFVFFTNVQKTFPQDWVDNLHPYSSEKVKITDGVYDTERERYIITGNFLDTLYFDISERIVADSLEKTFLASFDKHFNHQWTYEIGGKYKETLSNLDINSKGDIYLTGMFQSSNCDFGKIPDTTLLSDNSRDNYLAKFSSTGNLEWVKHIGNNSDMQFGGEVFVDNEDNVVLSQDYITSITLTDHTFDTTLYSYNPGSYSSLIVKVDSEGNIFPEEIYNIGTNGFITFDGIQQHSDNYYFSGRFQDSVFFKSNDLLSTSSTRDIFLLKTDKSLNDIWLRRSQGNANDFPGSITNDRFGNVYLTGFFNSTNFQVDSTSSLESVNILNHGNMDIFILKYNRNGVLQWGKSYGSTANDWSQVISHSQNILYLTGYYEGDITFGDDTLTHVGGQDFFVGTFDTDGNKLRAFGLDQQGTNDESGVALSIGPDNAVYTGGYFKSDSIGIADTTLKRNGTQDMFLGKFYSELSATFTEKQNISCHGGADGKLTVTPYFGVASYKYEWIHEGDTLAVTDSIATGLTAGDYTVVVTDAQDSTDIVSTTLTQPDSITFDGQIQVDGVPTDTLNCFGEENGDIYISPSGGTGSYDYAWSSPEGTGVVLTDQNQTDLSSGDFAVEITDENGCVADTSFTIYDPAPIHFGGTQVTNIGNFQNGAIDLSVSGGTGDIANYTYHWDGPDPLLPADTVQDLDSLAVGGNYTAQVTDESSCVFDTTLEVVDTSGFYIYFRSKDLTDVQCSGGSTGSAVISVLESSGNLAYTWKDTTGQDLGVNDSTISNLPAGKYYVTVEDLDSSETLSDSVVIDQPQPINLTFTSVTTDSLTCYGDADGIIDLEVSGGTPGYSYNWSNSETSQDQTKLTAGSYSVTVTDGNGCSRDTSHAISEPAAVVPNVSIDSEPSCYGASDGVLISEPTGGNGAPYDYLWNDPANQTTQQPDGLEEGFYTVSVTDSKGCEAEEGIALTQPDSLQVSANLFDVDCFGGSDGAIQLDVQGGTGSYNYFWTTENGSGLVETDKNQSGLTAAAYSIQLTDQNNCEKNRTFQITEPSEINITNIDSSNVSTCYGDNTGSITISAEGGTGALTYQLISGGTTVAQNMTGDFTTLSAGVYQVNVMDENDCMISSREIQVTEPPQINITSETITDIETCYGENSGALDIDASGGTGSLSYKLDLNGNTINTNSTGDFSSLEAGSYTLYVSDANGCEISQSYEITQPAQITIDNIDSTSSSITVDASGGTGDLYYTLNPDSIETNTTGEFTSLSPGTYFVEITDDNNCGPVVSRDIEISSKSSGINTLQQQYNFRLYPNPARQKVQMSIELDGHTNMKVQIINVLGNTVYQKEFRGVRNSWTNSLDLTDYNTGLYFVKIYMDGIFKGKANLLIQ
jgi:hypothetical protein